MLVHRPWGTYETLLDDDNYKVKRIIILPQQQISLQFHNDREEHWTGYGKKPTEKSKSLDKEYRKTKKSLDRLEKRSDRLDEHGVWSKDNKKGEVTLNTGGWLTPTTKVRMNQTANAYGLGFNVYQKDFNWFVEKANGQVIEFESNSVTFQNPLAIPN